MLEEHGYELRIGRGDWVEVGVFGHGEAWHAIGRDDDDALRAALRLMLPSALGWRLAVTALGEPAHRHAPRASASAIALAGSERTVPAQDGAPSDPALDAAPAAPDTAGPGSDGADAAAIAEALEVLEALSEDLDTAHDLGLFAPRRLRVQLLEWMSRARDLQDRRGAPEVTERVGKIAGRLGLYAKAFWPGTVVALQHACTPGEAAREFDQPVRDWDDVARLAEEFLAQRLPNEDDYGWHDAALVDPGPPDPHALLMEVEAELRKELGTAANDSADAKTAADRLSESTLKSELVRAAKRLRWTRGTVTDAIRWGRAMGRLRWVAQYRQLARSHPLVKALDPRHRPARSWAADCGHDEKAVARSRRAGSLAAALPPPPECTPAALVEWLRSPAGELHVGDLAPLLAPYASVLEAISEEDVLGADRTVRRRLRKLRERLAAPGPAPAAPDRPETTVPVGERPPQAAVVQARALVAGRRVLVVGNRNDPENERRLHEHLGITVDWLTLDGSARVEGACERIRGGRYDLVLAATSFMSHRDERPLRDAAATARVPYVRAGKCRLLGAALAIVRDLGASSLEPLPDREHD